MFVLTLFIFKAPDYVLARTLTERVEPHKKAVWRHNKPKTKKKNTIFCQNFIMVHNDTLIHLNYYCRLCVLFYSSFVYTCVCVFLDIQSPLRECRSIRSGTSGFPYYCASLVCISAVIGLLAVWWHNKPHKPKPKTKNREPNQTPTHTLSGGARPTLSAQCGPICTRTPSHPRNPLLLALITPTA